MHTFLFGAARSCISASDEGIQEEILSTHGNEATSPFSDVGIMDVELRRDKEVRAVE